jgi:murein DD-endopeptidase MepM/ murein hydrolase activator NlpD
VSQGQQVGAKETIALSGASGVADGPHLHFEVRLAQNAYDSTRNPLLWLYPFPDRGTVAGRVVWSNGTLVHEAPIRLRRVDAPSRFAATTTYAAKGVNPDEVWNENFALDDVEAGFYEVSIEASGNKFVKTVWVFPYRTSFVEIVLDASNS